MHYQAANLRTDIASKFVVFMLCAPDVPMMTYLDEDDSGPDPSAALRAKPVVRTESLHLTPISNTVSSMSEYDVEAVDRLPFTTPEKSERYRTEDYQEPSV